MPLTSSTPPPEPSGSEAQVVPPSRNGRRWPRLRRLAVALAAGGALVALWAALAPIRGTVAPIPVLTASLGTGSQRLTLLGDRLQVAGDTVYVWARTGGREFILLGAACSEGQLGAASSGTPDNFVLARSGSVGIALLEVICQAAPITAASRLRYRARSLWPGERGQLAVAQLPDAQPAPPAEAAGPVYMDSLMPR